MMKEETESYRKDLWSLHTGGVELYAGGEIKLIHQIISSYSLQATVITVAFC